MDYLDAIPLVILCEIANSLSIFDYIKLSSLSKKIRKRLIHGNWQFVKFMKMFRTADYFSYECFILNNSLFIRWARELDYCAVFSDEWYRAQIVLNQPLDEIIDFHIFRLVCKYGTNEQIIYYYEHYFTNFVGNMVTWHMIASGRIDTNIISKDIIKHFPKLYEFIKSGYQQQWSDWYIIKFIIYFDLIDVWYEYVKYVKRNGTRILITEIRKMSLNMFKAILNTNNNTDLDYIVKEPNCEIIDYMLKEKIQFHLKHESIKLKSTYDLLKNTNILFTTTKNDYHRWNYGE